MTPAAGDLCSWPRNPLLRDSKRRPVILLSPLYPGRSTALVVPLSSALASRALPLRLVIPADPTNGLQVDSLALCDQITGLLLSLLSEPFGRVEPQQLTELRRRAALAIGLLPSDLA